MQVFREMTIFEVSENGNDDVLRNMTILSFVKFGIVTPFQKSGNYKFSWMTMLSRLRGRVNMNDFWVQMECELPFFALGFSCQQKSSILLKKYEKNRKMSTHRTRELARKRITDGWTEELEDVQNSEKSQLPQSFIADQPIDQPFTLRLPLPLLHQL